MTHRLFALSGLCIIIFLSAPSIARGDPITVTSGHVTIGGNSIQISLQGNGFSLGYVGDLPPNVLTNISTPTLGSGILTFNSQTVQSFFGSVGFSNSILSGSVTACANFLCQGTPVFTVEFTGPGFRTIVGSTVTFTIATPEPSAIFLLALPLLALLRNRRHRT